VRVIEEFYDHLLVPKFFWPTINLPAFASSKRVFDGRAVAKNLGVLKGMGWSIALIGVVVIIMGLVLFVFGRSGLGLGLLISGVFLQLIAAFRD
jgi:hypothetical protein